MLLLFIYIDFRFNTAESIMQFENTQAQSRFLGLKRVAIGTNVNISRRSLVNGNDPLLLNQHQQSIPSLLSCVESKYKELNDILERYMPEGAISG